MATPKRLLNSRAGCYFLLLSWQILLICAGIVGGGCDGSLVPTVTREIPKESRAPVGGVRVSSKSEAYVDYPNKAKLPDGREVNITWEVRPHRDLVIFPPDRDEKSGKTRVTILKGTAKGRYADVSLVGKYKTPGGTALEYNDQVPVEIQ